MEVAFLLDDEPYITDFVYPECTLAQVRSLISLNKSTQYLKSTFPIRTAEEGVIQIKNIMQEAEEGADFEKVIKIKHQDRDAAGMGDNGERFEPAGTPSSLGVGDSNKAAELNKDGTE